MLRPVRGRLRVDQKTNSCWTTAAEALALGIDEASNLPVLLVSWPGTNGEERQVAIRLLIRESSPSATRAVPPDTSFLPLHLAEALKTGGDNTETLVVRVSASWVEENDVEVAGVGLLVTLQVCKEAEAAAVLRCVVKEPVRQALLPSTADVARMLARRAIVAGQRWRMLTKSGRRVECELDLGPNGGATVALVDERTAVLVETLGETAPTSPVRTVSPNPSPWTTAHVIGSAAAAVLNSLTRTVADPRTPASRVMLACERHDAGHVAAVRFAAQTANRLLVEVDVATAVAVDSDPLGSASGANEALASARARVLLTKTPCILHLVDCHDAVVKNGERLHLGWAAWAAWCAELPSSSVALIVGSWVGAPKDVMPFWDVLRPVFGTLTSVEALKSHEQVATVLEKVQAPGSVAAAASVLRGCGFDTLRAVCDDARQSDWQAAAAAHAHAAGARLLPIAPPKGRLGWTDLHGCDAAKTRFERVARLSLLNDRTNGIGLPPPSGVLLHGPPGCGKTLLVASLCQHLDVRLVSRSAAELFDKLVGSSIRLLHAAFNAAREQAPAVLLLDEAEALLVRPALGDDAAGPLLEAFLDEIDTLAQSATDRVLVVLVSNLPGKLAPAALRPGRVDEHISVPLPDVKGRAAILDALARTHGSLALARDDTHSQLLQRTDGWTPAALCNLFRQAIFPLVPGSDAVSVTARLLLDACG